MLTLNQIKQRLITWFSTHAQINTVKYQTNFDFKAERNLLYPAVNIEWLESSTQLKQINRSFKISIGDMTDVNFPDQVDKVHSDAEQIAEDFLSYLQYEKGWTFSKATTIRKFKDDTGDRVAGIVFTVTLSSIRPQNTCVKPMKN